MALSWHCLRMSADELLDDFFVGGANGARVGDHLQIGRFQIFKQDIAVEGQIELGLVEQVKDDDIVALEAELAQSFDNRLGLVEQIGD